MKRLLLLLVFVPVLAHAGKHLQDIDIDDCEGGLLRWDKAAKRIRCTPIPDCSSSQVLTKSGSTIACKTVATDPITPITEVVRAFRGCQGSGCNSTGGRGGIVYTVNTLADTTGACVVNASTKTTSGTCSLRDCIQGTNVRTCVFRVAGRIELSSRLILSSSYGHGSYLTIAGQTAPGGGIEISGVNLPDALWDLSNIHDVVVRYVKFRKGKSALVTQANKGGILKLHGNTYNVVFDHCSVAWSQEDMLGFWGPNNRDATVSYSIFAEPLLPQQTLGMMTGGETPADSDTNTNIDFHHNYLAHFNHRGPETTGRSYRWINNIVYNASYFWSEWDGGVNADIIGNVYKNGPFDGPNADRNHEFHVLPAGHAKSSTGPPSLYVVGNKGPNNSDPSADNWANMVRELAAYQGVEIGTLSTTYKRTSPMADPVVPITIQDAATVESTLLSTVGAYQRLGCDGAWVANRDAHDTRLVNDFANSTAACTNRCDDETEAGGFPTISAGTACTDTDKDGMPDTWETAQGLNTNDPSDAWLVAEGQVYPNLSRYLNGP